MFIAGFALMKSGIDPEHGWGVLVSFTAPWLVLAGWPLVVTRLKGNGPVLDLGLVAKREHLRLGVVGGLACNLTGLLIGAIVIKLFGPVSSAAVDTATGQPPLVLIFFVFLALVGAPIVEEIAFRGLLFGGLLKAGFAPWLTVVISAALFAGFHFEPARLPILFAVGVVLGLLRLVSGGIVTPIIAHAINNWPVLALLATLF
jgi:membrane protease YdiL (CAAX protease family)